MLCSTVYYALMEGVLWQVVGTLGSLTSSLHVADCYWYIIQAGYKFGGSSLDFILQFDIIRRWWCKQKNSGPEKYKSDEQKCSQS